MSTRVLIDTDLEISGRMAQFGRGAIADVSNRLIGQFVANLSGLLTAPAGGTASANGVAPQPGPAASAPAAPAAPPADAGLDVVSFVLPMIKERYGQALIGGLLGFVLSWLVFGRRVGKQQQPQYRYFPFPEAPRWPSD